MARRNAEMFRRALPLLVIVAFWLPLLGPLVRAGQITCSPDGMQHLLRAAQLDALVERGILWPRWDPGMALGYGYPLFNYYPALALFPALALHRLGLALLAGWNLAMALSLLASGLAMYGWAREVWGERGGLISALAYMLAPYALYDVYWRGNVTESLTLPLLPLVMWAALRTQRALRVTRMGRGRYAVLGAAALAAVLLMHAPASLMLGLVLAVYGLALMISTPGRLQLALLAGARVAAMAVLGVGLAAFFLVPAFAERGQVQYERAITAGGQNYANHFVSLGELVGPAPAPDPGLVNPSPPHSLGVMGVLLGGMGLAAAVGARRLNPDQRWHAVWAAGTLIVILFLMLPQAEPIWARLPLLPFIQFPWRFLGVGSLLLALLAGAGVAALERITRRGGQWAVPLCAVALAAGLAPWAYPRLCTAPDNPDQPFVTKWERSTGLLGTTSSSEYLPVAVREIPTNSPMVRALRTGQPVVRWDAPGAAVLESRDDGFQARLVFDASAPVSITYRAFYFPGWQARLDGRLVSIQVVPPLGVMAVEAPAGRHTVTVEFAGTPLRTASDAVSVAAVLAALAVWVLDIRRGSLGDPPAPDQPLAPSQREWLVWAALGLAMAGLKVGVVDRYDTPLRWRRLHGSNLAGVSHTDILSGSDRGLLLGYTLPRSVPSGETAQVDLYWARQSDQDFRVAVRLVDDRGMEWSDKNELDAARGSYNVPPPSSEWPLDGYADDRHMIRILPGTPPGHYRIVAVPFRPEDGQPLPIVGEAAPGQYPGLAVASLEVTRSPRVISPGGPAVARPSALGASVTVSLSHDRAEAAPGQDVLAVLDWQAVRPLEADYMARIELVDRAGQVAASSTFFPGGGSYTTEQWRVGEWIRSQVPVRILRQAHSGFYTWRVTLLVRDERVFSQADLDSGVQVTAPERVWALPPDMQPVDVRQADWVRLAGVRLDNQVMPGSTFSVTLAWQATGETDQNFKVFVHLLGPDGRPAAQSDAVPADWTRPTPGWVAGEYILDVHWLEIPSDLPPGEYRVVTGLYDAQVGGRLLKDASEAGRIKIGQK